MFSSLSIKECRSSIGGGGGRAGRRTARRRSLPLQTTNAAFATFTTVAYFSSFSVKWRRGSSGGGRDGRRAARRRSLPLRITTTTTTLATPTTVAPPPFFPRYSAQQRRRPPPTTVAPFFFSPVGRGPLSPATIPTAASMPGPDL